jgi:hypothetical protein
VLLSTPRTSLTGIEYPIVADIDNDGSAEIVVVSNLYGKVADGPGHPRQGGPVDPGAEDLEPAHVPRHQCHEGSLNTPCAAL